MVLFFERPTDEMLVCEHSIESYLTIRWHARGFYWLIVGEGQSPKPTIKDDRNRESRLIALAYLSDRSLKKKNIFYFIKFDTFVH